VNLSLRPQEIRKQRRIYYGIRNVFDSGSYLRSCVEGMTRICLRSELLLCQRAVLVVWNEEVRVSDPLL